MWKLSRINRINKIRLNKFIKWTDSLINGKEPANQKVDIPTLLTVLAITLPMDAFVYWRLFFDDFNTNYFTYCFTMEDVPYILYEKGSYCWYMIIILSIPSLIFFFKIHEIFKVLMLLIYVWAVGAGLVEVGGYDLMHILFLGIVTIITNYIIYYYNRNALFIYSLIIAWFFAISARTDFKNAIKNAHKVTIISKNGSSIINKEDKTKIYVGSTSKYVLIFDKKVNHLIKFERDTLR